MIPPVAVDADMGAYYNWLNQQATEWRGKIVFYRVV